MRKELKILWDRMQPITKTRAVSAIVANPEFSVTSIEYVKQVWIWGGKMPKEKEKMVQKVFQRALYEELEETKRIITSRTFV